MPENYLSTIQARYEAVNAEVAGLKRMLDDSTRTVVPSRDVDEASVDSKTSAVNNLKIQMFIKGLGVRIVAVNI